MSSILRKAIIRKVVNLRKKGRVMFWEKRGEERSEGRKERN
jgi:hypothetical protein